MDIIRQSRVKTRRPHNCWGCRMVLPTGSAVICVATPSGGTVNTAYWCDDCYEVIMKYSYAIAPYGDGYDYGVIIDEHTDLLAMERPGSAEWERYRPQAQPERKSL